MVPQAGPRIAIPCHQSGQVAIASRRGPSTGRGHGGEEGGGGGVGEDLLGGAPLFAFGFGLGEPVHVFPRWSLVVVMSIIVGRV